MHTPLIVVIGGTGYLGSHITRQLLGAGCRVRVAARHPSAFPGSAGVERQPVDILDEATIDAAVAGADAVVNAVSLYVEKRPDLTFEAVHVAGADRLASCCRRAGVPTLVHLSGLNPDPDSDSRYVSARGRGEQRVRATFPDAVILRPGALFGDGQGLLATLANLTRLPVIPLFGHGETRLQPVHVRDVALAVAHVIEQPDCRGRTYELGGADSLTYRELVKAVLRQTHRRRRLLPVPFALWFAGAAVLSVLPSPPLTRDQLILMRSDNVVSRGARGFADLGITPRGIT